MDIDAYVAAHRGEWQRLEQLVGDRGRLSGAEVDELVSLYQRTATHLSVVRSAMPDAALVARLSSLVARGRSAVTGSHSPAWRDAARFLTVGFPAAVYRAWRWWVPTAIVSLAVAAVLGAWVVADPAVQAGIATPEEIRRLVNEDFESYYSSYPAQSFAASVWTNNAWVAAGCLVSGVLLGVPTLYILWTNAQNLGLTGGVMVANDQADLFFGLILPHGLLELTAVFVAAGVGLRLGWTVVDPGPRRRSDALAQEGRAAVGIVVGLVAVFAVSGVIEAYVTPSGLSTAARVSVGICAELAFLTYVIVLGRRAVRAGETGDVAGAGRTDSAPSAA